MRPRHRTSVVEVVLLWKRLLRFEGFLIVPVVSTSNLINDNELGVELGYNLSLIQMNVVVVRGSVHREDGAICCSISDRC